MKLVHRLRRWPNFTPSLDLRPIQTKTKEELQCDHLAISTGKIEKQRFKWCILVQSIKVKFNCFNPPPAELINLNFHVLEVVSRYRDTQLQVRENLSYMFNLRRNIRKS